MAKHKQMIDEEKDEKKKSQRARKLESWTRALTQVADLKGKDALGRPERVFIEEIVKEINNRLGLHLRSKIPHLIGMYSSIDFIKSWMKDRSSKTVDILSIWGMTGIGKTALAKYVYKLHHHQFQRSSFVEGIGRKCAEQSSALHDLQKHLLTDILKKSTTEARDISVCTDKIEKVLYNKQTLLVLDDINKFEQLDVLIGTKGFHPGTKIIITTKDRSVTEKCALLFRKTYPSLHTKHNLSGLNYTESLRLLCWHAFGSYVPKKGYEQEAERVTSYCGGHPLALKILGSSLINEDVATWSHIFEMFETTKIYTDIQKVLQISFDLLPSGDCQELFKHIACFFVGEDRENVETILNECGIRASYGITKLIDRCLLMIGKDNELQMHQLVQEMGRDLVRQESLKKPWKRSRLWNHEESFTLLIEDKGTSKVRGLALDMKMARSTYETEPKIVELKTKALAKMDKLILLQLNHVKLKGSYKNFPQGLRWLCMHGFRLKDIPSELPMEHLAVLDMSYSDLEQLWKKPMVLGSLKILNLSHCIKLVSVGGFSGLPALERLILVGCETLNHVCESIGHCDRLELLDKSYCNKLRKLPNSIWKLKKVRILSISSCGPGVDEIPVDIKDMEPLNVLKEKTIPKMILHPLPLSLVMLSLKNINLSNESFPMDCSSLIKLKSLYLDNNPIDSLPTFVRSLSKLESLSLGGCSMIKSVLCLPSTLRNLSIKKCSSLMKITFHEEMSRLPYVEYMGAESLKVIPGVFKIQDLAQVDEKILSALGWTNLHCMKDQELDIWAPNMWVYKKKPVQMLYQFGIFSTCFLGKEVPDWLEVYKSSNGSSILSFIMPSTPVNKRFKGINIAYVHALGKSGGQFLSTIIVVNKTKNISWEYMGQLYVHREGNDEEMAVWLSHWMFGENEFEDGDEATLEIYGFLRDVMVNECVISPVYGDISSDMDEEEDDDPLTYYKSWKFRIGGDLSPFQEAPGKYSLFTKIRSG